MSVIYQQWVDGINTRVEDTDCNVQVIDTLGAPFTHTLDVTIASADDDHDLAAGEIYDTTKIPQSTIGHMRGRFKILPAGSWPLTNNSSILIWQNATPISTVDIYLDSSAHLNWFSAGGTLNAGGTNDGAGVTIATNTFYYIEILYFVDAGGTGYKKLWVNTNPALVGIGQTPQINVTSLTGTPANCVLNRARHGIDHYDGSGVTGYEVIWDSIQISNDASALTDVTTPTNTVLPVITGDTFSGGVATCGTGTWTGFPDITYQWQVFFSSAWHDDTGETDSHYTLREANVGRQFRCKVTGTNGIGNASVNTTAAGPITSGLPHNTALPNITGLPTLGAMLGATGGDWDQDVVLTYQWQRDHLRNGIYSSITGRVGTLYTQTVDDVGSNIRVRVKATTSAGSVFAYSNSLGPVTGSSVANVSFALQVLDQLDPMLYNERA